MIKSYKKFFTFAGKQKSNWYAGLVIEVVRCVLEALQFMALLLVFDGLVHNTVSGRTALMAFGIMIISVAGSAVTWYYAHEREGMASYRMCEDKRIQIGNRMKYMPMGYFNDRSLGELTAASTATMSDLESMAFAVIVRTLVGLIHATVFSLAMMFFDWRISLIFIIGVAAFTFINKKLLDCSQRLSPQRLAAQTGLVDAVLEFVQGMSVVKAFHMVSKANTSLEKTIADTQQKNLMVERQRIPYISAQQIVLRLASAAASFCAIVLYLGDRLELTICLMILISAFVVYNQLESAGEMFFMLSMIDASIDRVEDINQSPVMDTEKQAGTPHNLDIVFDHVSFSYQEKPVLSNINLVIPQNSMTAIVGPSGSGKTTLVNLIARFWDADAGKLCIGGIDVREYQLDHLMKYISMVFQNVYLFQDTIANNISFGNPGADHQAVIRAAKAARCHEFISVLPEGYDTVIGEGGATLSGGEKQRIAIARAILKDAPIVILDEATANVDPENEDKLSKAIGELTRNKTVIMIAHRLKTVKGADQIIVLDEGEIVQRGTHAQLLQQKGIYAEFISGRKKAAGWKISTSNEKKKGREKNG